MHKNFALIVSPFCRCAGFLFALLWLIPVFASAAVAQTSAGPSQPPISQPPISEPSPEQLEAWRRGMAQVPPPTEGCFTSSYPSTQWQEVPCTTAPERPYPPARGPRPATIGNGTDVSGQVTGTMSEAVGSFDSVTGVTSETGQVNGSGGQVANTFSLQLNTNTFSGTAACNSAANPSNCQGWEQFVYSNAGIAFIQYWLLDYAKTCPSGWNTYQSDCWKNGSNSVSVPSQTISNLSKLSLTGQANTTGAQDKIIMAVGSTLYSAQNPASTLNLYQYWQTAEFNVFGDCCSSEANFNNGSTIVVRTAVNNGTTNAPSCFSGGFTGETNNLSFAAAPSNPKPGSLPAIVFTESSAGGASSACASTTLVAEKTSNVGSITDTHDFNGDGYSDIVWVDTAGDVAMWLMDGTQILSGPIIANVPTSSTIVGQRQLNNSGYADLLWRSSTGDFSIWFMQAAQILSMSDLGTIPTNWTLVGTNSCKAKNGYAELFWRDTAGDLGIWQINGAQILSAPILGNVPPSWTIAGIGDFSGTGAADILWRGPTGDVAIWFMNGTQIVSASDFINVPLSWTIVGTGDFNGDGKTDILWRSSTGDVAIWLMNGTQVISAVDLGNVAASWTIAETGDFNGDGKTDILWRGPTGDVGIWFMNGTQILSSADFINVPTSWTIQGANAD